MECITSGSGIVKTQVVRLSCNLAANDLGVGNVCIYVCVNVYMLCVWLSFAEND